MKLGRKYDLSMYKWQSLGAKLSFRPKPARMRRRVEESLPPHHTEALFATAG
jgi:hypothetical protein